MVGGVPRGSGSCFRSGGGVIYSVAAAAAARGGSQERLWLVLIMMLGKALRRFLQAPRSRVHLLI